MRDEWPALRLGESEGPLESCGFPETSRRGGPGFPVTVFLLRQGDLADVLASPAGTGFEDRGRKHPARSLFDCFRQRGGSQALRAEYRDPGQAERGLRALLHRASRRARPAVYLVGIPEEVFERLRQRAPTIRAIVAAGRADESADLRVLLSRLDGMTVPEALVERYCGSSPQAELVRRLTLVAARTRDPVLILGETGTGKEVVARAIHDVGPDRSQPFVAVNCSAIPADLFESEVFGHRRGAFTGAVRDKPGFWAVADGGTLFLDEIGDLTPAHQAKILRTVESGRYLPIGSTTEMKGRARIIAATHHDLERMVAAGHFREDLYFRLFNFRIRTPALREHPEDIPAIAERFWKTIAPEDSDGLPAPATDALKSYYWPGNARELRAFLSNLWLFAGSKPIDADLVHAVFRTRQAHPSVRRFDA